MDKKPRLGSDPLEWIRDTRKEEKGESKQIKQAEAKTGSQAIETVKIA